jgi:hypothetical protein
LPVRRFALRGADRAGLFFRAVAPACGFAGAAFDVFIRIGRSPSKTKNPPRRVPGGRKKPNVWPSP